MKEQVPPAIRDSRPPSILAGNTPDCQDVTINAPNGAHEGTRVPAHAQFPSVADLIDELIHRVPHATDCEAIIGAIAILKRVADTRSKAVEGRKSEPDVDPCQP